MFCNYMYSVNLFNWRYFPVLKNHALEPLAIRCFGLDSTFFYCHLLLTSIALKSEDGSYDTVQVFRKDHQDTWCSGASAQGGNTVQLWAAEAYWVGSGWAGLDRGMGERSRFFALTLTCPCCFQIWLENTACRLCRMFDEVLANWEWGESSSALWTGKEASGELVGWRPLHDAVQ